MYRVTAQDGSTKDYTVRASVALSSSKEITAFSFNVAANTQLSENITGTISGTDIAVILPNGTTDLNRLVADFTTTGGAVTVGSNPQFSGNTANNFTNRVTYTVTAMDGSTKDYTVTVSIALEMTSFQFLAANNPALDSDVTATIQGDTIACTVPYGTDVSALVASFDSSASTVTVGNVSQTSGASSLDYSNAVGLRILNKYGMFRDYEVVVNIALNSAKELTSFCFRAADNPGLPHDIIGYIDYFDFEDNTVVFWVPPGIDTSSLVPTFTTTGESVYIDNTIQHSNVNPVGFTNSNPIIEYTVFAEDGSSSVYFIAISTAEALQDFQLSKINGTGGTYNFSSVTQTGKITLLFFVDITQGWGWIDRLLLIQDAIEADSAIPNDDVEIVIVLMNYFHLDNSVSESYGLATYRNNISYAWVHSKYSDQVIDTNVTHNMTHFLVDSDWDGSPPSPAASTIADYRGSTEYSAGNDTFWWGYIIGKDFVRTDQFNQDAFELCIEDQLLDHLKSLLNAP